MLGGNRTIIIVLAAGFVASALAPLATATHDHSLIELDGNAADVGATPGLDWASLFTTAGDVVDVGDPVILSAFAADFAKPDASYHDGSDKDTEDVPSWQCAPVNNPQDKTNILNAYGALLTKDGSFYFYFGFERETNNGNSFMGFWLLQRGTECEVAPGATSGNFTNPHTTGDLLVLSDFTGGGTVSSINVYRWNPNVVDNLELVLTRGDCGTALPNDPVCGRVNGANLVTPWLPGSSSALKSNTFFEAGLNLTSLLGTTVVPCFTDFVAETRSSQELSATLKDYALGSFRTCDAKITVDPLLADNPVGTTHTFTFTVMKKEGDVPFAPAAGETVTAGIASGPGTFVGSNTCVTDANGQCSVTITSNEFGATVLNGAVDVVVQGVTLHRETDGKKGNSADAVKTWHRIPSVVATLPTAGEITLGESLADTISVSGSLQAPNGTVDLYACQGDCATGGVFVGSATLVEGGATIPFTPTAAGAWCFRVDYLGDATYEPSSDSSPNECFEVLKAAPGLETTSLPNGDNVAPGTLVIDLAIVTGAGPVPTGTIAFSLCGPTEATASGCAAGAPVATVTLDGSAQAVAPALAVEALGLHCWRAEYSGDANYLPASHTNGDTECFTVRAAVIDIGKLVNGGTTATAEPGDTVEFTISVTNSGNLDATGVVVSDTVPIYSTLTGCAPECANADPAPGGLIEWTLGTLAAGATTTVSFTVALDDVFPDGVTLIPNVASVTTDQTGTTPSDAVVVTVEAHPILAFAKSVRHAGEEGGADAVGASPGDEIEFVLVLSNSGDAAATGVTITDAVPIFTTLVSCACDADGSTPGSLLSWSLPDLMPGESVSVSFVVALDADFPAGTTVIPNAAVATTNEQDPLPSNEVHVYVDTFVDLTLAKVADKSVLVEGETVTFTLAYANLGNATAIGVIVRDPIPEGATFVACDPECVVVDGVATWSLGDVPAGAAGLLTLTVAVGEEHGCEICNVATIATQSEGAGEAQPSNGVCITIVPDVDEAIGTGSAVGVRLVSNLLGVDQTIGSSASSLAGEGDLTDANTQHTLALPADGSVVYADVIRTLSTTTITPAGSRTLAVSEVVGLDLMGGLVTASKVRASVETTASGLATSVATTGSVVSDLRVNGAPILDSKPGTRVPLAGFGAGSYVQIGQRASSTTLPAEGSGGAYGSTISYHALVLHLADVDPLTPLDQPLDLVVASASGAVSFPQLTACGSGGPRAGAANAALVRALGVEAGAVAAPPTGGDDHRNLGGGVTAPETVTSAAFTIARVTISGDGVDSNAMAAAAGAWLLDDGQGGFIVSASEIVSQSLSFADDDGAASGAGDTHLVGLSVAGSEYVDDVGPNEVIDLPGVGYVVLNEQTADAAAPGSSGLRVRAIHLVITQGPLAGEEIVVAEAYSTASSG